MKANFQHKTQKFPIYAVQFDGSYISVVTIADLFGVPLKPTQPAGFVHDNVTYNLGDWVVLCLCENCAVDPDFSAFDDETFQTNFEPIPTVDPNMSAEMVEEFDELFESLFATTGLDNPVAVTKSLRQSLDDVLQRLKRVSEKEFTGIRRPDQPVHSSRERAIAVTKIQEAIMWLGMDLKALGTPNPYPESYNPKSPVIEPTADGLKL